MDIQLAKRLEHIKPSATLTISAKASAMKKEGHDIIDLSLGEPDFQTPEHIKQAAITAIKSGFTRYTPVDGIIELKKAIAEKFKQENQLTYSLDQIIVSTGAKQSLFNVLLALLNPDDEVLIPAPFWVSYPEMVSLAEAKSVFIPASIDDHFKLQPEKLEKAITPKTRLLILNSLCNPSGVMYSEKELRAIAEVLLRHPHIFILSDDIYEHIQWKAPHFINIVNVCPELYERTIVINGVSKAYAMTGWRIGYAAGAKKIIAGMKVLQSQSTSNPCSIAQYAALAALTGSQDEIRHMCSVFKKRHDLLLAMLSADPNIKIFPADGTFYLFPCIQKYLAPFTTLKNDVDFAAQLLEKTGVASVPGSAFGLDGYLRLSYALNEQDLEKAALRILAFINAYAK